MKVSYFGRKMELNGSRLEKSLNWRKIRRIILDGCAVPKDLDYYEDHCLNLKHTPPKGILWAVYETLVNDKDLTCFTPDTPYYILYIRRIDLKTSPKVIQDTEDDTPYEELRCVAS